MSRENKEKTAILSALTIEEKLKTQAKFNAKIRSALEKIRFDVCDDGEEIQILCYLEQNRSEWSWIKFAVQGKDGRAAHHDDVYEAARAALEAAGFSVGDQHECGEDGLEFEFSVQNEAGFQINNVIFAYC